MPWRRFRPASPHIRGIVWTRSRERELPSAGELNSDRVSTPGRRSSSTVSAGTSARPPAGCLRRPPHRARPPSTSKAPSRHRFVSTLARVRAVRRPTRARRHRRGSRTAQRRRRASALGRLRRRYGSTPARGSTTRHASDRPAAVRARALERDGLRAVEQLLPLDDVAAMSNRIPSIAPNARRRARARLQCVVLVER